jgi:arginase
MMPHTHIIGYAVSQGGPDPGVALGPLILQNMLPESLKKQWIDTLYARDTQDKLDATKSIAEVNTRLALHCESVIKQGNRLLVLGGDHTQAIGTWSGVQTALNKPLGLIWIDAHMDAHDADTTPSQNVHGMPLAALLGDGDPELTGILTKTPKIQPEHLILIGTRSYEPEEQKRLADKNVRIYFMDEIKTKGLNNVMQEAYTALSRQVEHIGISLDIDAIDPTQAPAVSVPEPDGLDADELIDALDKIISAEISFCGLDITEFNPVKDHDHKTEKMLKKLLGTIYEK